MCSHKIFIRVLIFWIQKLLLFLCIHTIVLKPYLELYGCYNVNFWLPTYPTQIIHTIKCTMLNLMLTIMHHVLCSAPYLHHFNDPTQVILTILHHVWCFAPCLHHINDSTPVILIIMHHVWGFALCLYHIHDRSQEIHTIMHHVGCFAPCLSKNAHFCSNMV